MAADDLTDSTRNLVDGRARAIGSQYKLVRLAYPNASSSQLMEALSDVPREQKISVGLLLAEVILEDALATNSKAKLSQFFFRYGAHLKGSVSAPGLTPASRLSLAIAASVVFDALPFATSSQRADAHGIRVRLAGTDPTDRDWRSSVGVARNEFEAAVELISNRLNLDPPMKVGVERAS